MQEIRPQSERQDSSRTDQAPVQRAPVQRQGPDHKARLPPTRNAVLALHRLAGNRATAAAIQARQTSTIGGSSGPLSLQRVVEPTDLTQPEKVKAGELATRIKNFPHEKQQATLDEKRQDFKNYCAEADSTIEGAREMIAKLEEAVETSEAVLKQYSDAYTMMAEAMKSLQVENAQSYGFWQPTFETFNGHVETMEWSEIAAAVQTGSEFKLTEYKLRSKHPKALADARALADADAAAKVAAEDDAAARASERQQERAAITHFVRTKNATQVFTEYLQSLKDARVTVSEKYAGGRDPISGLIEDGESTYSRKYTFDLDPKVGEVHIHWRPFGGRHKPTKWHFKRAGHEGETGATHQYNLSMSLVNALGITGVGDERIADDKIGQ